MRSTLFLASFTMTLLPAPAADWPQFRRPDLNGVWRETGWNTRWSGDGPKVVWRAKLGVGFSTVTVSVGRVVWQSGKTFAAYATATPFDLDWQTGATPWAQKGLGVGSLTAADGKLICRSEMGELLLITASSKRF